MIRPTSLLSEVVASLTLALIAAYQTLAGHFIGQLLALVATGVMLLRLLHLLRLTD